jgi:hypothetical protein
MESINITSMERVFHKILADMTLPPRKKKGDEPKSLEENKCSYFF